MENQSNDDLRALANNNLAESYQSQTPYKKFNEERKKNQSIYNIPAIYAIALIAGLGWFYFGYYMAVFNTLQDHISYIYGWSDGESSFFVVALTTVLCVGAAIGAFLSGIVASHLGRRKTIILTDLLAIAGISLTFPVNIYTFFAGRFLIGLSAGSFSNVIPIYISESLPEMFKGVGGVCYVTEYCCGVLTSWALGFGLPPSNEVDNQWWRLMFGLPLILLFVQLISMLTIYRLETPGYLLRKINKKSLEDVQRFYSRLYADEYELGTLMNSLTNSSTDSHLAQDVSFKDLLGKKYRKHLFVGVLVNFFMEMTAFYGVIFYSNSIFLLVWEQTTATLFTSLLGVAELIGSLLCFLIIERWGRRTIFLLGQFSCSICMLLVGLFWQLELHFMLVAVFIMFVFFFALTLDTVIWIFNSEILPDKGSGICTMVNWLTTIGVSTAFPIIVDTSVGLGGTAFIFGGISFGGAIFVSIFVNEKKEKEGGVH